MKFWKKKNVVRQDWKPNFLLRLLKSAWSVLFSLVKIALGAVATVALIIIVCGFVLVGALGDYLQDDVVPNISFELDNVDVDQTSFIYYVDSDGEIQEYQQIYTSTDRQWASLDEIPEDMIHAAIAIEDKRFYEHQGVDWITTVKACANMFFGGSDTFGGSTITQQMLKNVTQRDEVTVQRKVEEIFKAQKFEMEHDKDTVMEWYLNYIYLGDGCYGVKSAAWHYFGKNLDQLTTAECACLISITNNPSLYSPYLRPENNRERQLIVLSEMYNQGWITQEEYDEAVAQEMVFKRGDDAAARAEHTCESCGYSNTALYYNRDGDTFLCPECGTVAPIVLDETSDMYSWMTEMVLDDVALALCEQQGLEWNDTNKELMLEQIKRGGYHIYSTIDVEVQDVVDEIYTNMSNIPTVYNTQKPESAIVIIDNRTGDVVAAAGATGVKEYFDATNHATDDPKQTGSAMKPLTVYAPAFELGAISPASVITDLPLNYDNGAFPLNDTRSYRLSTSVLTGVASSINTTAVRTLDMITTRYGFDFAVNRFRLNLLESEWTESGRELSDIGYSPLGLGALTYGLTVREMATAYATFPNDGTFREGRTFTKVYDSEGNLIIDNTQESETVMSKKAVDYVNYTLRQVVTSGTAYYANMGSTQAAGKTGTSSDNRDRWFVGYTEYYTAAVWFGFKVPEEVRLSGDGSNPAGRLWLKVMQPLHEGVEYKYVSDTSNMTWTTVCLYSGDAATAACQADPRDYNTQSIMVYPEDLPNRSCTKHVTVDWCTEGDAAANEFCKQVEGVKIESRGLYKYTQKEIDEIKRAGSSVRFFEDEYIYLINSDGSDADFHGIRGGINEDVKAPYKVCTVHTEQSVVPETEPPVPSDPTAPSEPAETTPAE